MAKILNPWLLWLFLSSGPSWIYYSPLITIQLDCGRQLSLTTQIRFLIYWTLYWDLVPSILVSWWCIGPVTPKTTCQETTATSLVSTMEKSTCIIRISDLRLWYNWCSTVPVPIVIVARYQWVTRERARYIYKKGRGIPLPTLAPCTEVPAKKCSCLRC